MNDWYVAIFRVVNPRISEAKCTAVFVSRPTNILPITELDCLPQSGSDRRLKLLSASPLDSRMHACSIQEIINNHKLAYMTILL